MNWQDRIIGMDRKPADQFSPHELNARTHPRKQREAVRGSLDTLGWIAPIIVSRRPDGSERVIDGHERIWQALDNDNADVPYVVVELSENEEKLALASYDFMTTMAEYDKAITEDLLREVNTTNASLQSVIGDLADKVGAITAPETDTSIQNPLGVTCPECGCEFSP